MVRDEQGDTLVRHDLPENGAFELAYRHSYYRAPARELFVAAGDQIELEALASPRAAVLDYYALAGERTRHGRWLRLVPAKRRRYERLPLIATTTGRRALLVGGDRISLYGRYTRHLEIALEGAR